MHDVSMSTPSNDFLVILGKRVRALREKRGWGQAELAAYCGLNRVTVTNLENGRHEPKLKTIQSLARNFEMTMSALLKGL